MIDATPKKVLLAMPSIDGKMHCQTVMSMIAVLSVAEGSIRPYWNIGDSNISHCRSGMAHYFKTRAEECDTLFFLDTDIVFSPQDFAYMLEGPEQVVIAPYARKVMGMPPTGFGMGFCRIHRSVFEMMDALVDEEGKEELGRYYITDQGVATHYFQTGAGWDAQWFGEDTGFWNICAINGITQRLERRTNLGHIGNYVFHCPDQMPPGMVPYSGPLPYPEQAGQDSGHGRTDKSSGG